MVGTECHGGRGVLAGHEMAPGYPPCSLVFDCFNHGVIFSFAHACADDYAFFENSELHAKNNTGPRDSAPIYGRSNGS